MGENNFEQTLENYLAVRDRTPNPTIVAALQMAVSGSVPESKLTEALAERDAIGKDLERQVDLNHAQLEEIERLRQLVGELSDDLAAEINDRYPQDTREKYQSYQMKWERDMDPVLRARKALGKE